VTAPDPALLAQVRGFVEGNMNSRIRVMRGARGGFDKTTGLVTGITGVVPVYEGPARVRDVTGATVSVGELTVATGSTTVSYPASAPAPHRDDLVVVLDSEDLEVITRTLHVDAVASSAFWSDAHRMSCTAWMESGRWGE
jgi:hypothetical protein